MEKFKVEQRVDNAFNVLFNNDEELLAQNKLNFGCNLDLPERSSVTNRDEKVNTFKNVLKQAVLFFPGAVILYGATIVLFWNYFSYQPDTALCLGMVLVSSIMLITGIGDIKNFKHLLIPLSIITTCTILFFVSLFMGGQNFMQDASYYLFPLVFTLPFLVKGLTDTTSKINN